jgi:hypothetical protein
VNGGSAGHFNIGFFEDFPYFPFITTQSRPYIKKCAAAFFIRLRFSYPGILNSVAQILDSFLIFTMVKGLATPYKREHGLKYGLEVAERHPDTSAVVSARCLFCVKVGRASSDSSTRKRARTENVQYFKVPFRADNMKKHAELQHLEAFEEYSRLGDSEKKAFFDDKVARNNTLHAHFDGENALRFLIKQGIVDVIIGDMLFDPDDVDTAPTRARALEIFKLIVDPDRIDGGDGVDGEDVQPVLYEVKIASSRCFDLVLGFVSCGSSFRMSSRLADVTKSVSNMGCFAGCTEGKCAMYTRVICAVNLQKISEILSKCWAFAIALDVGSKQGTSYLDFRVRFYYDGLIHNFHVLAIPLYDRKTAAIIKNCICTAMDVICADWRARLIAVSTDGERTMTGRISGVATLFQQEATHWITRIWCALHQFDLVAQKEYQLLHEDKFFGILIALVSYLRRQFNLISEMKATCPKFMSTRWLSMKKLTSFLEKYRVRICEYLVEKNPTCKPKTKWWILMLALDRVATELADVVSRLQGHTCLLGQQTAELEALMVTLKGLCPVAGPHDEVAIAAIDQSETIVRGSHSASTKDARAYLQDLGSFVLEALQTLDFEEVDNMERSIAGLFAGLIDGISRIFADRNENNEADNNAESLPVLPHLLVKIRTSEVSRLVLRCKPRLIATGWTNVCIEQIERDHRDLLRAFKCEPQFASAINRCSSAQTCFEKGWAPANGRFEELRAFCGGLATVFPNTAPVESDFSLIGWEKNDYRQGLTDFSLEGILQAKQYKRLLTL